MYVMQTKRMIFFIENCFLIKVLYKMLMIKPNAPIQIDSFINPLPQNHIEGI